MGEPTCTEFENRIGHRGSWRLITQLLPAGAYGSLVLVLAYAIYFKGAWTSAFDPNATAPQPFTLADGTQVISQMMQQEGPFAYCAGANFQMVRLPYGQQHLERNGWFAAE